MRSVAISFLAVNVCAEWEKNCAPHEGKTTPTKITTGKGKRKIRKLSISFTDVKFAKQRTRLGLFLALLERANFGFPQFGQIPAGWLAGAVVCFWFFSVFFLPLGFRDEPGFSVCIFGIL